MSKTPADIEKIKDEFLLQYGKSLAAWAHIELALNLWFIELTGMDGLMSSAVFYSGRSFQTRKDMLFASLLHTKQKTDSIEFMRAALKKAAAYSGARNQIAHRNVYFNKTKQAMILQEGEKFLTDDGINPEELLNMMDNFNALGDVLLNVLFPEQRTNSMSPGEGLARVRELPNRASDNPKIQN
jgi:hypothetical protein